jgi:hypothetical protein
MGRPPGGPMGSGGGSGAPMRPPGSGGPMGSSGGPR